PHVISTLIPLHHCGTMYFPRPHYFSTNFYSSSYPEYLDLHSFPTRRSSDLSAASAGPIDPDDRRRARVRLPADRRSCPVGTRRRSEEHTSELQSPYDIVCRLLLEKKKKPLRQNSSRNTTLVIEKG